MPWRISCTFDGNRSISALHSQSQSGQAASGEPIPENIVAALILQRRQLIDDYVHKPSRETEKNRRLEVKPIFFVVGVSRKHRLNASRKRAHKGQGGGNEAHENGHGVSHGGLA